MGMLQRLWKVTPAQDDALNKHAADLGISKNELVRRVLDEWRSALEIRQQGKANP